MLRRRRVRASLTDYARFRGFNPARHHRHIITAIEAFLVSDEEILLLFAPPGSAKALALDTPIPTPTGWKAMGSLRVGDKVFDEAGKPCNVTWVSPVWRDRRAYVVRTDCGDEIIADEEHEWRVRLCGKAKMTFATQKTKDLCRRRSKRPMIKRAASLDLPEADLPIEPYLLGVWLGDGHSAGMRVTSSVEDQAWLIPELQRLGVEVHVTSQPTLLSITGQRAKFAAEGLLHDPAHSTYGRKHIPPAYLRGSRAQRLALLQGLIDTDGTVCRERGCTTFCSTNIELADGVRELARSLGVKAWLSEGRASLEGRDCGPVYRVSFYMADSARMPRKAARARDQHRTPNTYIDVTPVSEPRDTVCIEVDSPSHLFLCGRSMTPTHNSTYLSHLFPPWYLARFPGNSILAATHSVEFAERWGRRCRNDVASDGHVLGIELAGDSQAAARWALNSGGEYYGVGAGVGISGFRADLGLGDDFFGSREDAYSETVRRKRWDWYLDDFSSRLKPGAKRILMNCMTGDTPVTMANGAIKRLADIAVGDDVIAWQDGAPSPRRILNWVRQGEDDVLEIKTGSSTVKANARHPFLVETARGLEWRRAGDLRKGDKLVTLARLNGDGAVLNEHSAWLLGYMFGDGWVTVRDTLQKGYKGRTYPRRGFVTCAAHAVSAEENQTVGDLFEAVVGVRPAPTAYGYSRTDVAAVGRWFRDRGLTGNAKTKRLPAWIFAESEANRVAFLTGYNAADGYIHTSGPNKGRWTQHSVSRDLIADVRQLARSVGYRVSNISTRTNRAKPPHSPVEVVSTISNVQWGPERETGPFITRAIRSIKPASREEVYDIEVEGAGCFIADGVVSHNTRWHEGDVAGRVLEQIEAGAVRGRVVSLPALAEENDALGRELGQPLWDDQPEYDYPSFLRARKRETSPMMWAAIYQQRPAPEEGDFFQRSWFPRYAAHELPKALAIYGTSDYAVTGDGGDRTIHRVWGVDHKSHIWLLAGWKGQQTTDVWIDRQLDLIRDHKPYAWFGEAGAIQKAIEPFLIRRCQERKIYCRMEWLPSIHDKPTRARGFQARAAMGMVHIPMGPEGDDWLDEMIRFPTGKHDDEVDTASLLGRALDEAHPAVVQAVEEEKPTDYGRRDRGEKDWMTA